MKKFLLSFLFVVVFFTHVETTTHSEIDKDEKEEVNIEVLVENISDDDPYIQEHLSLYLDSVFYSNLDTLKVELKRREGYREYPYSCSAGHRTVGHGHVIQKGDNFTYPMSRETADSLLAIDVIKRAKYIKGNNPSLNGMRLLTITAFCFNTGCGFYDRSTLREYVDNNMSIDTIIPKYAYYKSAKTGNMVRSEWLYQRRLYELELYNRGVEIERKRIEDLKLHMVLSTLN